MKGRMELDRDEELSFFRELRKRQNEHFPSLLLSASEDYERDPNGGSGKFSLYKIPSGRKEFGLEFLETNKSEFDWLKTPPATPLFASLEMEPSAQLCTQKELPISQPISRVHFPKSDMETPKPKAIDRKENHTNSIKSNLSRRSITPSQNRQRPSSIKNTNEQQKSSTHPTTTKHNTSAKKEHDSSTYNKYPTPQKNTNNDDSLALTQKKNIEANISQRKPKTRGISPSIKSSRATSDIIIELSNETPSNLKTDKRSSSSTRGRSTTRTSNTNLGFQNQDPTPKSCRSSRSPSPSMSNVGGNWNKLDGIHKNLRTQRETFTLAAGNNESRSSYFKGSKMVEKVVNARKSGNNQAEKETKSKPKYRVITQEK